MAGDLNLTEYAVVLEDGTRALDAGESIAFVHKYGSRVLIAGSRPTGREGILAFDPATQDITRSVSAGLDETERIGLEALRRRLRPDYIAAKRKRPREGYSWDMPGCTALAQEPPASSLARAQAPTSSYLEGSVALGLVIVEGPTANLQFSEAERIKVAAEVQNGLSWLGSMNPAAGITFTYDFRVVTLNVQPNPNAPDREALWRDPAMGMLGFTANWNGVIDYVEDIRNRFGTRWTYCAFFTKYPLGWFAYASIGGPRLVMDFANDGWGPDNIDRVFAHESGHIFGCPDEYAASNCNCGGTWGRFGTPNTNCENCAPNGGVACLMKANTWAMCAATPSHFGWVAQMPAVRGNPVVIQSRLGQQGNFELAVPAAPEGMYFSWRNNDSADLLWSPPMPFGQALGQVDAISMIQSNFGSPGNLELIARSGDRLSFFWRDSGPAFQWNGPFPLFAGARGNPVLIQSRFGTQGNFELVTPAVGGGLLFSWRNNDDPNLPWSAPMPFAQSLGAVDEITLIQSNFGSPGNLELIVRAGEGLYFLWRDSGPGFQWSAPDPLLAGAGGNPVLIQSRFGNQGNFELVVPASGGGGMHFLWRNNDAAGLPWSGPQRFGQQLETVEAITLIQSNYGSPGNLELIARSGDRLYFFWRDSGPAFLWNGPFTLNSVAAAAPPPLTRTAGGA